MNEIEKLNNLSNMQHFVENLSELTNRQLKIVDDKMCELSNEFIDNPDLHDFFVTTSLMITAYMMFVRFDNDDDKYFEFVDTDCECKTDTDVLNVVNNAKFEIEYTCKNCGAVYHSSK